MTQQDQRPEKGTILPDADIHEIMRVLPHRYPFLMIDHVKDIVAATSAIGIKNVTYNEPQFQGHFPDYPVMPGVLITEAMAQTGGVLTFLSMGPEGRDKLVFLTGIEGAKFRRPIMPGHQIHFHSEVVSSKRHLHKIRSKAMVDGKLMAEAVVSAAIIDK